MAEICDIDEEAVDMALELLVRRHHQATIRKVLREKFGIEQMPVFENALRLARQRMMEKVRRPLAEAMAEAFGFYESAIRAKDSDLRVKIKAQERLDKLQGLEHMAKREAERKEAEELERSLPVILESTKGDGGNMA